MPCSHIIYAGSDIDFFCRVLKERKTVEIETVNLSSMDEQFVWQNKPCSFFAMVPSSLAFFSNSYLQNRWRPVIRRTALIKNSSIGAHNPSDLNANQVFPEYKACHDVVFPTGRQFDNFQCISYLDSVFQSSSLDRVTVFGLRPPEFRFVTRLTKNWTFFVRVPIPGYSKASKSYQDQVNLLSTLLNLQYSNCMWIDGLGYQVKIRQTAVSAMLDFI
jgi:hypothetical protein